MRAHHVLGLMILTACVPAAPPASPPTAQLSTGVRPGIEVLLADSAHLLRGQRVGLLTNHTGIDRMGRRSVDLLIEASASLSMRLAALFSPEHGFRGTEDRPGLPDAVDSATGLPIYSLYSGPRLSRLAALDTLDVVLVDLQDVGARYYTYVSTAILVMREAARRRKTVIVLDRPNPLGGLRLQGNVRVDPGPLEILVGPLPVSMRHGLTFAEMMVLANDVYALGANLRVVPLEGWQRAMYFDGTGLPWVPPSPNMPSLESAMHYPGTCLFEYTNLSVGRGTPFAFQTVGAPWLDAAAVVSRLANDPDATAGVRLSETVFTPMGPTDGKFDGRELRGIRLEVTNRDAHDPTRVAIALLAAVRDLHPDSLRFQDVPFDRLAAGSALREALMSGQPARNIWTGWQVALEQYRDRWAKYLLY